ncbi:MAG TPA: NRDE family protein [Candidatus Dormibacteraeota bacterium]|nr:NRDE family protein [Candidatus Dormibacteraeota bacterium]
MCTILVAWRVDREAPVLLAANRDELIARPTHAPGVLREAPRVAGGRDAVAGGTWLAVSAAGRVAAVTNRRAGLRDPSRRSRGELPLLLLDAEPGSAATVIAGLDPSRYNPANLLDATVDRVLVGQLEGERATVAELSPGVHALTTVDVDDRRDAKVARLLAGAEAILARGHPAEEILVRLERLLEDHGPGRLAGPDAACIHGDVHGTRSSSSVVLWADGRVTYRVAPGRPCEHPRADLSALLEEAPETDQERGGVSGPPGADGG